MFNNEFNTEFNTELNIETIKHITDNIDRPLRLIVAGSPDFKDMHIMHELLTELELPSNTELVCGGAKGADQTARLLWKQISNTIHNMTPNWDKYGRSAGYRRNAEMAQFADICVAFWDGKSRGTKHMIEEMHRIRKPFKVFYY